MASGFPAVVERRIRHHGIEIRFLGGVGLAQHFPIIGQRVAVEDFKLRILHPVQQHVHARQVVGGNVLFLTENLADAMRPHALAHVEEQRTGTAGKIQNALQLGFLSRFRLLAVQRDDARQNAGNLLRRIKLTRLLAGTVRP
jgi:hypothetical protein